MIQKLKYWLIPQGWLDLKRKLIKKSESTTTSQPLFDSNDISQFKNIHKGKRCFILASGPSINNQDLSVLANEYCISVSQFFLHPKINEIKPQYHCFAPQHAPFDDGTNKIIFDNYIKHCTFPNKCFIGTNLFEYSYYNFLKKNPEYNVDAFYLNYQYTEDINEHNYQNSDIWDITKRPFLVRTVIYEAIQVAYYMGFSEIYLLGVDHDYLKDVSRTADHHFYEEAKSFSDQEHLSLISKEEWFFIYHLRWKQYRLMKTYLNSNGVQIYNATPNSMLDVFPMVDFESVMKK